MSATSLKLSNTTSFDLDGDVLLLVESTGRLILLNEMAASIWRGLESSMSVPEISAELAARTGCPPEQAARDCAHSIDQWRALGAFDTEPGSSRADRKTTGACGIPEMTTPMAMPAYGNSYRLLDLSFALRATHASDARTVHDCIGHLAAPTNAPVDLVFDLARSGDGYTLRGNGCAIDECDDPQELVPMMHANLLLAAYRRSDCVAALHASAVARGQDCILMPGASGSGKSTLATALLAQGYEFCTDDLAVLTGQPLRIRTFPMRIGLKTGAWGPLASRWPQLDALPVHWRADGQSVRYFLPPRNLDSLPRPDTYEPSCVVFPSFRPAARTDSRRITTGDALLRLTEAGYDLPSRMDRHVVSILVDWLSTTPCYELTFCRLDQAVDAISTIAA